MAAEDTIPSQYVEGFRANLNLVPQQIESRLVGSVDADLSYSEPGQMYNADDLGTTDPEDVDTRVPKTPDKFLGMTRTVGSFIPYNDSAWLDRVDQARELEDPTNKTMAALMAGRWRHADRRIINAVFGNRMEKQADGTFVVASNGPTQTVAANSVKYAHEDEVVPSDGSDYGFSIGKLLEAQIYLDASEIEGERCIAWSAKQKADLLRSTPVTNTFYSDVKALTNGKIAEFLGFKFIRTELLPKVGANRRCFAWIKPAIVYKARPIVDANIRIRYDYSDTPQAFYKAEDGGTRRYDLGVVEIDAKEF